MNHIIDMESKIYRNSLANDLKQESLRSNRIKKLACAKLGDEYTIHKIKKYYSSNKTKAEKNNFLERTKSAIMNYEK